MLRLLTTRWYLMLLTLFAPVLAYAQAQNMPANPPPRDLNPGWGILIVVGLIVVVGYSLIYFRRYSNDYRSRSGS